MWKYKGTDIFVKINDKVKLSRKYQKELGYVEGVVCGLHGFITVQLPDGSKVDFDSRNIQKV